MTRPILLAAILAALPAQAQDLPPPPPPPSDDAPASSYSPPSTDSGREGAPRDDRYGTGAEPTPPARPEPRTAAEIKKRSVKWVKGTIGEGPVAPAGAQTANLHPDEEIGHWRFALASGVIGRWGGDQIDDDTANSKVMLYFGGQADGLWTERYGRGARFRLRLMTGGEGVIFIPSDGDAEAAFMLGRREFRFVAGRIEVARHTALGLETLLQAATFPSVEGSVSFRDDKMRLSYFVAPVEAAWVYYKGDNHIAKDEGETSPEHQKVYPATAVRVRYTGVAPPAVLLSLQADFVRMWGVPDTLVSLEGSAGFGALDNTVLFNIALRWDSATRRTPTKNGSESDYQMLGLVTASLLL